jgi:hypothetical protein
MAVSEIGVQGLMPVSFGVVSIDHLPNLGKRKPGIFLRILKRSNSEMI